MIQKKRKIIILAGFCILGIIASIPGFMMQGQKTNMTSVKSALLNPKYVQDVNVITLSFPEGSSLIFKNVTGKTGTQGWICNTQDGCSFPVNGILISQLLEKASQTRSMALVSDSYSAWHSLGLSEDYASNLIFANDGSDGSQTAFSSLFFGYKNADSTMMYVRSDRKSSSWRIQDDFSSYLTDNLSFWADQHILPTVSSNESDTSRTQISVETASGINTIYNGLSTGAQFDDAVHTLLSLRSSEILTERDFLTEAPQAVPVLKITLKGDSVTGPAYGFTVYEADYDDGTEYFARNFGILSDEDSSYLLQISEWTLNKMLEKLSF